MNFLKQQKIYFDFVIVILLHSKHRHVSATHVAIFRVVSARIQIYSYVGLQILAYRDW